MSEEETFKLIFTKDELIEEINNIDNNEEYKLFLAITRGAKLNEKRNKLLSLLEAKK